MKALLRKDYLIGRKLLIATFGIYSFLMIIGVWQAPPSQVPFLVIMLALFSTMLNLILFAGDDEASFFQTAPTLPLKRDDIVQARYVTGFVIMLLSVVFSLIIAFIASLVSQVSFGALFAASCLTHGLALALQAIVLPALFVSKKPLIVAVVFVTAIPLIQLSISIKSVREGLISRLSLLSPNGLEIGTALVVLGLAALFYGLSFFVSRGLFRRKDIS